MGTSQHQIQLTPSPDLVTSDANSLTLLQELKVGLQGGEAVYNFFSGNTAALQNLYETIATSDDTAWLDGTDSNGNPMQYIEQGNNFISVYAQVTDQNTLQNGTGGTTVYKQVGLTPVVLTTDQGTALLTLHSITYAGDGIGGLLTTALLKNIVVFAVKTVKNFLQSLFKRVFNRSGGETDPNEAENQVNQDAESAAGDAGADGADLGGGIVADFSITVGTGAAAAVGVVIILIMLVIQLLEKQMTDMVKFYNVTAEDIQFGMGIVPLGGAQTGPAPVGQTVAVTHVSPSKAPPNVIPTDTSVYRSDLTFINTNPLSDIAYVLEATPSGDFPGFRVAVWVANTNDNVLYVSLTNDDCNTVWSELQQFDTNDPVIGTTNLTMSATSGKYTLQIATNQNHGKSPSPLDGTVGYNYQHLIVLTDGSIALS